MALAPHYRYGQQPALRILKTKRYVTRKQAVKHMGQPVNAVLLLLHLCIRKHSTPAALLCYDVL